MNSTTIKKFEVFGFAFVKDHVPKLEFFFELDDHDSEDDYDQIFPIDSRAEDGDGDSKFGENNDDKGKSEGKRPNDGDDDKNGDDKKQKIDDDKGSDENKEKDRDDGQMDIVASTKFCSTEEHQQASDLPSGASTEKVGPLWANVSSAPGGLTSKEEKPDPPKRTPPKRRQKKRAHYKF